MGETDERQSLFQSIGDAVASIQEKLADWDGAIREKTGDRLTLPMVAGILAILLILLVAVFSITNPSRGFSFSITDANGDPLSGAIVRLFDDQGNLVASARSANGTARFSGISDGKYSYSVSLAGYAPAKGTYDPSNPASGKITLVPSGPNPSAGPTGGSIPESVLNPASDAQPPSLPSQEVILPGGDTNQGGAPQPVPTDTPGFGADAKLTVLVHDNAGGQPVFNAVVSLYDGSTQAFLVQGRTNAQGQIRASVKLGGSITLKVGAQGFAPSSPKTVAIGGPDTSVDIGLSSLSSGQAMSSNVTVMDANDTPLSGVLVQIFPSGSSFASVQLNTSADGRVSVPLQKGATYATRASKPGYQDATQTFSAGNDVRLVLQLTPSGVQPATLTVSLVEQSGLPSPSGLVGVFKKTNSTYVPLAFATGNSQGIATLDGFQANWTLLVNATSSHGLPSVSKELNLTAGANSVQLVFPAISAANATDDNASANRTAGNATGNSTSGGVSCPDGSNCPSGSVCVQTSGVFSISLNGTRFACQVPDSGTVGQTDGNGSGQTAQRVTVCTQSANGRPTRASFNGVSYSLIALNAVQAAAFEVTKNTSVICTRYSPDCQYRLGTPTAANQLLAGLTGVNVTLVSIDPKNSCVDLYLSAACQGGVCSSSASSCPLTSDPVCASNGVTYSNDCEAGVAKAGTTISGACNLQCSDQVDPVCADNGIQYVNACQALADNKTYTPGACQLPSSGLFIDVPSGWSAIAPMGGGAMLATDCTSLNRYVFQGFRPTTATYFPVKPTVSASTAMQYGDGYFVYSGKSCRIYWQYPPASSPYVRKLSVGWDLVGAPSKPIKVRDIMGDCRGATFWSLFGSTDQTGRGTLLGPDDVLAPGHGYWANYDAPAGSSCNLSDQPPTPDVQLYRCFSNPAPGRMDHMLSVDSNCEGLPHKDGPFGRIFSKAVPGTVPLYRCRWTGGHFETQSASCENAAGAAMDGTLGYVYASAQNGLTPFYRCFNGGLSDHMASIDAACEAGGFANEGILGYLGSPSQIAAAVIPAPSTSASASPTAPSQPSDTPTPTPTPAPLAVLCKRQAVGTCAVSGTFGAQACGTSCPSGFSSTSESCAPSGAYTGYGISGCAGSAKCQSDETYPSLIQCKAGDLAIASAPSDTAIIYTCKQKAVGTCAETGLACANTCPAGFSGAQGSCAATGSASGYGINACTGSAQCLKVQSYLTFGGCGSDLEVSRSAAAAYSVCRHAAVGNCGSSLSAPACANTCPAGFDAAAGSCTGTGTDASGYGLVSSCIGSAQCLSKDSYVTSGSCNPGDIKVA